MSDYREQAPPSLLARYLLCVWMRSTVHDGADLRPRIVPDGCIDIFWIDDSAPSIAGPETRPVVVPLRRGSTVVGVRFRPGVAPTLLGLPADELLDTRAPLEDIWGHEASRLADQVPDGRSADARLAALERALVARLPVAAPVDGLAEAAVARLIRRPATRVQELTQLFGVSERQLLRRFSSAVGYGPKTFSRIVRFQRTLRLARETPAHRRSLAQLARETGYADQAHMTREITRLAGVPPVELLSGG